MFMYLLSGGLKARLTGPTPAIGLDKVHLYIPFAYIYGIRVDLVK